MSACLVCSAQVEPRTAIAWRKDGHDIVRCPACRFVFRAELPDQQALDLIYDEGYFRDEPDHADRHGYSDYLKDAELHRANARRRLRLLARRLPAPGSLLDVGCAAGFFVDEALRAGWHASGIDVSATMVDWARSELGIPVSCASFTHDGVDVSQLDAVTMWDYIEHSVDPRADLERAHDLLRPDGLIALSTGDIGSLPARLSGRRWHLLTPEHHNFFFEKRTLRRLLESSGFEVLEARRRASLHSVSHVLYKLGSFAVFRRAASRARSSRMGRAGIPINLYDIVTVVARRQ